MKIINNLGPRQVADFYLKRLEKTSEQEKGPDGAKRNLPPADSVEISGRARELQFYRARLKELPEVRAHLVESVKKELAAGKYRVDSKAIAAGILEERRLDRLV